MFKFGHRSEAELATVDPRLSLVMRKALEISPVDFGIIEGKRAVERQRKLFAAGATRTMKSKHITGHAVDVVAYVDGQVRWDWPLYAVIAASVKKAAAKLHTEVGWGGDWKKFKDGPHFELRNVGDA